MASLGTKRKREVIDLDAEDSSSKDTRRLQDVPVIKVGLSGATGSRRSTSPPKTRKPKTTSSRSPEPALFESSKPARRIDSPIKLTKVEGLPESVNIGTVSLEDILGNPLIRECWAFNYLTDIDFLLSKFDSDIREQVKLTVVHGFWKEEQRANIKEVAARHANIKEVAAYMPEPFGTHHSKMLILTRHDDLAQVVIMTTNFIEQDWRMTQAAWLSPLLPLLKGPEKSQGSNKLGSGSKFKSDLLLYLKVYQGKLKDLVSALEKYDFSEIKAALIASVPSGAAKNVRKTDKTIVGGSTQWGWPGLKHILSQIPCSSANPEIVIQISSVASLGTTDTWLRQSFFNALANSSSNKDRASAKFHIVFPVAEEIRRCISGYECGSSIHMKTQNDRNKKQLNYIKPMLCQWAGDTGKNARESSDIRRAGRRRAGPHIKTYIRFTDSSMTKIDWAMVTSANLSNQAWGSSMNKEQDVRVSSYEIGVIVWPDLFNEDETEQLEMVPVFMKDQPDQTASAISKVGFRMPYDLPLVPYGLEDEPWCATQSDHKEDWMGRSWPGY